MKTRHTLIVGFLLAAMVFVINLILYPQLPDLIPIHWGLKGEVDGYAPKSVVLFMGPGLVLLMAGLTGLLPRLSPKKFSIKPFEHSFNYVMLLVMAEFAFLHLMSLIAALFPQMDSGRYVVAGICVFLALIGNMMGKIRRNYWMGVKTPWTLASDVVWNNTHRKAAWLFVFFGFLGAVLAVMGVPTYYVLLLILPPIFIPIFISYFEYKKWKRETPE